MRCDIVRHRIEGTVFLIVSLVRNKYLALLEEEIDHHLMNFPVNDFTNFIWQPDGAPAHRLLPVREYLSQIYDTWIGIGGTIRWPTNSQI